MADFDFDCAVIGGGPAGLVSALYFGRFRRKTVVVRAGDPRASWIPKTRNLLGYEKGISGTELLQKLETQVAGCGVDFIAAEAQVRRTSGGFLIRGPGVELRARKVIIATGGRDVDPLIGNLRQLRKRGLLRYCPICDAYEYRGKPLVVLAQDDHGLKTALFLSRFASRLDVVVSLEQDLPPRLVQKCLEAGIRFHRGRLMAIEEVRGGAEPALLIHVEDANPIACRAAYVAMGFIVNDLAFRHFRSLPRAADGRLQVGDHNRLPIPGLFAVGDCVESLAQISVAAGAAAVASTAAHNELRENEEGRNRSVRRVPKTRIGTEMRRWDSSSIQSAR